MNLPDFHLCDAQLAGFERLYARYKALYFDPDHCTPMIIVNTPISGLPAWEDRIRDPEVMLSAELANLKNHLAIGDDHVPAVRVQFGTAQIAAAFGCQMALPPNSLPACHGPVMQRAEDVRLMAKPGLLDGWYGKLKDFTTYYLEHLPEGVHIQHPDIQSPFNSAHLIRGNDILLDLYDHPEDLDALLDLITDYMIELVPYLKSMISQDYDWFFDWGALWKGTARISNCTMHLISPQHYLEHVLPRDRRLLQAIGGGRIHYCGSYGEVIDAFFLNTAVNGLDFDAQYHKLSDVAARTPCQVPLLTWYGKSDGRNLNLVDDLLAGKWPAKKNVIIQVSAGSVDEGRQLLNQLRRSMPA